MSQTAHSRVISMPRRKTAKTGVERKRAERARKRDAGLVSVTVHVPVAMRAAVRAVERLLCGGGILADRLQRYLTILADKDPLAIRRRARLPKPDKAEADRVLRDVRKAQVFHIARYQKERKDD